MGLDVKEAFRAASDDARALLGPRASSIRLEEVESSMLGGREIWLITLSLSGAPEDQPSPLGPSFRRAPWGIDANREYKVFAVAKDTGEILSMKVRLLETQ